MKSKVSFVSDRYGNYQDHYYTSNYNNLITHLLANAEFEAEVNLGVTNGVLIENTFVGDFHNVNCAVVERNGKKDLYKIIKRTFIRKNQWRITMVKDIVSEKYESILDSKVLVSRLGLNRKVFDPLLLQQEVLELSEVKTKQHQLSQVDGSKVYGYIAIWARDSLNGDDITWKSTARGEKTYDILVSDIETYAPFQKKLSVSKQTSGQVRMASGPQSNGYFVGYGFGRVGWSADTPYTGDLMNQANYASSRYSTVGAFNRIKELVEDYKPFTDFDNIERFIGKVVFDNATNSYYEIKLSDVKYREVTRDLTETEASYVLGTTSYTVNTPAKLYADNYYKELEFTLLSTVPVIEHKLLNYVNAVDQPFQIFYIPITEGATIRQDGIDYTTDKLVTESMLYDLISAYSGTAGKLLDVQLVSYCPVDEFIESYDSVNKRFNGGGCKERIDAGGTTAIFLYEVPYCSYSLFVPYTITVDDYKLAQKKKIQITSPSGASVYDFSVAKNGGLTGFIIDVDIRPYASFHRIQPIFNLIYGTNYNDTRGLIYQEDMSLTVTTSAWETYKRQNINYMASFNAEQNYKRSQLSIDQAANWGNFGFDAGKRLVKAGVEAATFAAEAVAQDVWFGAKGGVSGAAGAGAIMAGAVVSEGIEAAQLAYNNHMDNKKLEDNIAYSREQYNYNLGNIKAIPENLEKVSGVFVTNNLIPYIQEFEPTEDEIEYFKNYLDTYGVNLGMMVDLRVKEFDYLQGTIIQFGGVVTNEEYSEIHSQLTKGVRKYGW